MKMDVMKLMNSPILNATLSLTKFRDTAKELGSEKYIFEDL